MKPPSSLPTENMDANGVLNDLYASLEKVVVHLREAVAATFTSRKRLNYIRCVTAVPNVVG